MFKDFKTYGLLTLSDHFSRKSTEDFTDVHLIVSETLSVMEADGLLLQTKYNYLRESAQVFFDSFKLKVKAKVTEQLAWHKFKGGKFGVISYNQMCLNVRETNMIQDEFFKHICELTARVYLISPMQMAQSGYMNPWIFAMDRYIWYILKRTFGVSKTQFIKTSQIYN